MAEIVALNFAKVQVQYQEQDAEGKARGGLVAMTWDVAQNTED